MEVITAPTIIDLDALLAPISDDAPTGEDLKYSGLYDEIKEARRADDGLSQGDWAREMKVADWRKVVDLATEALKTQTKDFQIGAWLSEALVKRHGFVGMRDSLKLMNSLLENFWENCFPEIDEDNDLEARANAFEFFDQKTAFALKEVPITAGAGLSYYKWEESKQFDIPEDFASLEYAQQEKYTALQQQANEENRVTGDQWRKAKSVTRRAFYEEVTATLEECWTAFETLDRTMDDKFGNQTPGLGALKKSLDDVRTQVKRLLQEKREQEPDPSDNPTLSDDEASASEDGYSSNGSTTMVSVPGVAVGAIRSRQDALKNLGQVAEYFRKTEPHSPVSYLVQRAVKWGNMSLEAWLQDVIKDEGMLGNIRETLGINQSDGCGSGDSSEE